MGHTLVDVSTSSANVLMINHNAEEMVLPCRTCIGQLVPISAVSVAQSELQLPTNTAVVLPEYLEDIVQGSHTSLGDTGRQSLRDLLHRCLFVCWSLTSLCHSNGHIETMTAREINPFTALTRIRS